MQNQPDKVAEAVPALLETVTRKTLEPGMLATARSSMEGLYRSIRIRPRTRLDVVYAWLEDGLEADPRPTDFQRLQSLDVRALEAFMHDLQTHGGAPIITIVGDGERIGLGSLADKYGAIRQVTVEQLFA